MTYDPGQWTNFFITVGGATAALTGLVFVAMSLNAERITVDATHRFRAIGTLAGFLGIFTICALVLMGGQDNVAVGIEWAVVATLSAAIYLYGYVQAVRLGGSVSARRLDRVIYNSGLYLVQIAGGIFFALGQKLGLYAASVAMVVSIPFFTSGAWLLITGVVRDRSLKP